ncbi:hypothetical protein FGO68_gene12771 [Halteria grandinella]|uniref:Uncharacterized protein n=1 Tax=Halteria grandinella TaxID=5974 RepID=A0A8J8T9X1_HALGN|nr:hypothetical protein FGO68_gene12771 [Halteria grandinella]
MLLSIATLCILMMLYETIAAATMEQKCKRNLFPIVFGGNLGESSIDALVHFTDQEFREMLAIGGFTKDSQLVSEQGVKYPYVAKYSMDRVLYEWGKYFIMDQSYIIDMAVNDEGTILISFMAPQFIMVVQSAQDGYMRLSLKYKKNVASDSRQNNLILISPQDSHFGYLFMDKREGNDIGFTLIKFDYLNDGTVYWYMTSSSNLATVDHSYGFLFAETPGHILIYSQSSLTGNQMLDCIDTSTSQTKWTIKLVILTDYPLQFGWTLYDTQKQHFLMEQSY